MPQYCIKCKKKGETKNASFGLISDGRRTHCGDHRSPRPW